MVRRLKEYRARNDSAKEFFVKEIGHHNVLAVNATLPAEE